MATPQMDIPRRYLLFLRLDDHAYAVVFAALVLLHLCVGFGVVEVGVRVESAQHFRNGAIVNDVVGLIAGERLSIVIGDDLVYAGELLQAVAEGGLVSRGLSADLLADEHAGQTAGGKEDDEREKSATSAG